MSSYTATDAFGHEHRAATLELLTASIDLVEALVNSAVGL